VGGRTGCGKFSVGVLLVYCVLETEQYISLEGGRTCCGKLSVGFFPRLLFLFLKQKRRMQDL
jgi:hypothetical protein